MQNHAAANKAQKKAVKEAKKKKGGSDSGANSRWNFYPEKSDIYAANFAGQKWTTMNSFLHRASTPVGDRVGVSSRPPKRSLADDERSNSSR